ncbi:MAG: N-acetylmuramoyl-L-alanine amidase [Syntrophobacterales bacterium]|nr:MAG: N-acetylmuramoyl-L-alanine amidase [Syntrophobacterales bacterium]
MVVELKRLVQLIFVCMLLVVPVSAAAGQHVVVIDPAHGGKDGGVKLSQGTYEKNVTLAIANLVKNNLSNADGIEVRLTRSDDRDVSLAARKMIAEKPDTKLLVSLHINAGFGQNAEGYEVYYLGATAPSVQKDGSGENLRDIEQTRCFNDSVRFAQLVQRNMGTVFPRKGRGLRNAPVHSLQSLSIPAVLLESGFATNLEEKKKLRDIDVQKSIADALTRSIQQYFTTDGES